MKLLKKSKSSWILSVVLISKKDKSIKFYVDYKKPNAITVEDAHPLSVINNIIDKIKEKKYYILLDLVNRYWQVEINENL